MPFVKFVQFVKFVVEKERLCKLNSICQVVNQKWKSISYSYIDGYAPNNLRYGGVAAAPDDSVDFSITIDADALPSPSKATASSATKTVFKITTK